MVAQGHLELQTERPQELISLKFQSMIQSFLFFNYETLI